MTVVVAAAVTVIIFAFVMVIKWINEEKITIVAIVVVLFILVNYEHSVDIQFIKVMIV